MNGAAERYGAFIGTVGLSAVGLIKEVVVKQGTRTVIRMFVCVLVSATYVRAQEEPASGKISAEIRQAAATTTGMLPVFIEFKTQPQAEILRRTEAWNVKFTAAKSTFERMSSNHVLARTSELDAARSELDDATAEIRHSAAKAIRDAIQPEQDSVSLVLATLGATNVERYYIVNVIRAAVPAFAIAALAARPEVVRISLIASGAPGSDVAAALGAAAFWNARPTGRPNGYTGAGQTIAVLDSGIREDHPAFKNVTFTDRVFLNNASRNPQPGCT